MHTLARRVSLLGDSLELECVRVSWKIYFHFLNFFDKVVGMPFNDGRHQLWVKKLGKINLVHET